MTINVIPGAYKARSVSEMAGKKIGMEIYEKYFSRALVQNAIETAASKGFYKCSLESPYISNTSAWFLQDEIQEYWGKLLTDLGYVSRTKMITDKEESKIVLTIYWGEVI